MTPKIPPPIPTADTVFRWINAYGLATVIAVVLLAYVLWQSISVLDRLVPMMETTTLVQAQMLAGQRDTTASLAEIQRQHAALCIPTR